MLAYDAKSTVGNSTSNSISWSHTCTGSNRILFVGIYAQSGTPSGVTYNGVGMTLIKSTLVTGTSGVLTIQLWCLINPATGSNTVTVTTSSGGNPTNCSAISYSGAKQSAQPDSSNFTTDIASGNTTPSTTVVASNCWLIGFAGSDGGSNSGMTDNQTSREAANLSSSNYFDFCDSNGTVGTGSQSIAFTSAGNNSGSILA